ncbi:MAG: hypothetical protein WC755_04850 [Candidatus Woesearchaeota archaeon]
MINLLFEILIFAYACVGIVTSIGYIPTIKDLWVNKKKSANISSYIIWIITTGITFLYSLFVLPDMLFRIASGLNFISCIVVLFFIILLGHRK